jgi:hypothetical protein
MLRSIASSNAMQASLTPFVVQQVLARDQGCIFSGCEPDGPEREPDGPDCADDSVVVTWIFPPFFGYDVSAHYPMIWSWC